MTDSSSSVSFNFCFFLSVSVCTQGPSWGMPSLPSTGACSVPTGLARELTDPSGTSRCCIESTSDCAVFNDDASHARTDASSSSARCGLLRPSFIVELQLTG
jgi:hypothetical protein